MWNDETRDLPAAAEIGAALRLTTERLARELAAPGEVAPDWSEFEWRAALAVAVMHGVAALLARRLRWSGPALWQDFLAEQLCQGEQRQQRIESLLARLDRAAAEAGIAAVALKGSALLGLGLYGTGERPMGDIDLLVREADAAATGRLLGALGFAEGVASWRHRSYLPAARPGEVAFGEHPDNPLKIELHVRIMERMPMDTTDITARAFPPQPRAGLNPYPSTVALMRHLLLHAAGNLRTQAVRLIQLHDIALLSVRLGPAGWQALLDEHAAEPGSLWWLLPPLSLTERCFPGSVPPWALQRAAAACPALLRRAVPDWQLTDMSLSQLWIPALPGWQWSRSPGEALRYLASRVAPDRATRDVVRQEIPLQPALAGTRWSRRSQLGKILQWLVARPPRVQTLYMLRCASAYRPQPHRSSA